MYNIIHVYTCYFFHYQFENYILMAGDEGGGVHGKSYQFQRTSFYPFTINYYLRTVMVNFCFSFNYTHIFNFIFTTSTYIYTIMITFVKL